MKHLFTIIALFGLSFSIQAQDFKSAVGLRLGYPVSVSYKTFLSESNAAEAFVGFRNYYGFSWVSADAAYQIHSDLEFEGLENLQWYYGAGAGINNISREFDGSITFFSLKGYIGLSYTLEDIPLNISIDWTPGFFIGAGLTGIGSFGAGNGALAVRYVLNTD